MKTAGAIILGLFLIACVSDPKTEKIPVPGRYIPNKSEDIALFLGKDYSFIINERGPCSAKSTTGDWAWLKPNLHFFNARSSTINTCTFVVGDTVFQADFDFEINLTESGFTTTDKFNLVTNWVNTP